MSEFMIAESGIRQLHARFIDAVWRKDNEAFANCFTESAEWKIAGLHFKGRTEIGETIRKLLAPYDRILITLGLPVLDVEGNTATGRIHLSEQAKLSDGSSALTIGVYFDRYVLEEGNWKFNWRHFSLHYRGPNDMSAPLIESPDYGPPPAMPPADAPTLTRRTDPI